MNAAGSDTRQQFWAAAGSGLVVGVDLILQTC